MAKIRKVAIRHFLTTLVVSYHTAVSRNTNNEAVEDETRKKEEEALSERLRYYSDQERK